MKSIQKLIFLFSIFGLLAVSGFSQSVILKSFSLSQIDESVFLRWTILKGETCNGIKIYRSTDSLNYQQIGDIAGVCGSPDFAQSFEFIDADPVKNRTNFYKLELGNTGFSDVRSIDIIALDEKGAMVWPNPASESTKVYFENEYNNPFVFRLYSIDGQINIETESRNNYFLINTSVLEAGIYIFTVSGTGQNSESVGRIVVIH